MTPYRLNDRVAKILADDQKTDVDSGHMAVAGVILAELEKAYASRHRADLSADLVRAGLEAAAKYHDEIYEHDASGIEHSSMVGIAISNRAELEQSCRRAEMNAREIRAMASDPEVIAAIVARVTEGK